MKPTKVKRFQINVMKDFPIPASNKKKGLWGPIPEGIWYSSWCSRANPKTSIWTVIFLNIHQPMPWYFLGQRILPVWKKNMSRIIKSTPVCLSQVRIHNIMPLCRFTQTKESPHIIFRSSSIGTWLYPLWIKKVSQNLNSQSLTLCSFKSPVRVI